MKRAHHAGRSHACSLVTVHGPAGYGGSCGVVVPERVCRAWGDSMFNLFSIPSFAPRDRALRRQINGCHELVANTILVLAGIRALAALAHHYVWKDEVLRRMLPMRLR